MKVNGRGERDFSWESASLFGGDGQFRLACAADACRRLRRACSRRIQDWSKMIILNPAAGDGSEVSLPHGSSRALQTLSHVAMAVLIVFLLSEPMTFAAPDLGVAGIGLPRRNETGTFVQSYYLTEQCAK